MTEEHLVLNGPGTITRSKSIIGDSGYKIQTEDDDRSDSGSDPKRYTGTQNTTLHTGSARTHWLANTAASCTQRSTSLLGCQ